MTWVISFHKILPNTQYDRALGYLDNSRCTAGDSLIISTRTVSNAHYFKKTSVVGVSTCATLLIVAILIIN